MTLKETLELFRWSHCTLCVNNPFEKELKIYKPTNNYDELGVKYLQILSPDFLKKEVVIVRPTMYNYVNVFIENASD
jgi:hypothetical protein